MKTKLIQLVKSPQNRKLSAIVAIGLTAMLLLLLSDGAEMCQGAGQDSNEAITSQEYAAQLERRMEELISSVDGAGRCQVMVTLENGVEYVYASEDKVRRDSSESSNGNGNLSNDQSEDSENKLIIIDGGNGEEALVRTELMPTVSGVVVVCEGAEDPLVRERIEEVVTTALNISSKRVCITLISD